MSGPVAIYTEASADVRPTPPSLPAIGPLTRDLLAWLARTPRTYTETMDAWRSTCPRLTIWEDALADGLVRLDSGNGMRLSEAPVVLTPRGHSMLNGT